MGYVLQGTCFLGERAEVLGRVRESVKAPESGRRGAVLLISLCAVASLAMPASSFAGTLSTDGSDVRYVGTPGEQNNITVDLNAGTYTVTDIGPGVILTALAPCAPASPTSATCPQSALPSIDHLSVGGDDLNDLIRVNAQPRDGTRIDGASGDDTIIGSAGPDKISGGTGDDVIDPNDVSNVDMDFFNSLTPCDTDPFITETTLFHCPDFIDGDAGFNTLRFDNKPGGVVIDATGRGPYGVAVSDPNRPENGDVRSNLLVQGSRGSFRTLRIIGTPGTDEIIGSVFDDTLVGRGGDDVLCGGLGNDTVDYSGSDGPVNVTLDTNLPPDDNWESTNLQVQSFSRSDCRQTADGGTVQPAEPKDCIANDGKQGEADCVGVDVENLIGSQFNDTLVGNDPGLYVAKAAFFEPRGMNVLDGGGGDDTLDGLSGADAFIGGDGTDTVTYGTRTLPVKVSLDGAANDGGTADVNPDTGLGDSVGPDVENLIGGSGDDTLGGSAAANTLLGGAGSDTLQGEGGDDVIDGQDGDDQVPGTFETKLSGGPGNDVIRGGLGDDTLDGGLDADSLDGGDGEDAVDYSNSTTSVVAVPDGVANDGSNGGAEGDNLAGTVEDLWGGSAGDTLVGNGAPGVLDGGGGDDSLDGGGGPDLILGGAGIDTATYAGRAGPVTVDLTVATGNGEAGEGDALFEIEAAAGGNGNDSLAGDAAVNILSGGPGNDALEGRGADDQLFGGAGDDTASGSGGADTLAGNDGNDNLFGGTEADVLNGGGGDDSLEGGAASDILAGDDGNDTAMYAARSAAVSVTLDGADNDGESGERDQVRLTTESLKTGSGNDRIDSRDGVKGNISCGAGNDVVQVDQDDTVANDCEEAVIGAASVCTIGPSLVNMNKKGSIRIKVRCPRGGKGTLKLRTVGKAKRAKKVGSKRVTLKAGKRKTVTVKLTKTAKRLLKRHKGSLRAHATVSVKTASASTSRGSKRSQNLTIMAPRWRR